MMNSTKISNLILPKDKISMYCWWQMFMMFLFDVDFNKTKWKISSDPVVRDLSIFIPKHSWQQMIRMSLFGE